MDKGKDQDNEHKRYYPYLDVVYLAKAFSKHFHENSLSPNFFINQIKAHGAVWDSIPTDEPIKDLRLFLQHSYHPQRIQKNIYYKAERANQHLVVSEILSHYFWTRLGDIHYHEDPIVRIDLQWLMVAGHRNPMHEEEETFLLKNKQPICLVRLETKGEKVMYLDLCGPQVDIYQYSEDGHPFLMLSNLESGELYSNLNQNVKIISIEEPVPITSEENF